MSAKLMTLLLLIVLLLWLAFPPPAGGEAVEPTPTPWPTSVGQPIAIHTIRLLLVMKGWPEAVAFTPQAGGPSGCVWWAACAPGTEACGQGQCFAGRCACGPLPVRKLYFPLLLKRHEGGW